MKLPKIPKLFPLKPQKRLNATTAARRIAPPIEDEDDEPQTKLSSAFFVVLILHVVAVGGIYAFNGIKAHRKAQEPVALNPAPKAPAPKAAVAKSAPVPEPASAKPAPAHPAATPATPAAPVAAVAPISGAQIHHVKQGDTLAKISAQYGVPTSDLEESNALKSNAALKPGQMLNVPKVKPGAAAAAAKKTEEAPKVAATAKAQPKAYVVAKGDNPVSIARKLGVSYDELLKVNGIEDPKKLQIGQTLKVPQKKN
jgi:LysM repeat protein